MKDRAYEMTIALICVVLALLGIYYVTADSAIWNEWRSGGQSSAETSSGGSSDKIDDRLQNGTAGGVITKQAPGEEIDIRPPVNDKVPETGKELTDRIPETPDWI